MGQATEKKIRKGAWLKVEGKAKYNDDYYSPACLQARLLTSVFAHAEIVSIDTSEAYKTPGVKAVVTDKDCGILTGSILRDMPVLAIDKVRYFGEPVAIVVADEEGKLQALKADFFIDSGAYADTSPVMSRAAAVNCSGVYNIPCIECDSVSVYTNHVYATSFRGFGYEVSTFAIERSIEKLGEKLNMDSARIRIINAFREGDYTPTLVKVTLSNTGNPQACISRLKEITAWDSGTRIEVDENIIRAKGMACFSKTSSSPTDASSAAIVTFCSDGSVLLNCSAVECGPGMTTALPRILAERLKVSIDKISMNMEVNTQNNSEHWKTVASMTTYMVGNAIIEAADDAVRQLKENAALALRCSPQDIEIEYDRNEHTFRLLKATTVLDAGKVIEPGCAAGQVMGSMNTGLSIATREINHYDPLSGELKDTSFRTYKMMHFNENPEYYVEFIETPNLSGPLGARGLAEHGVLGMPSALANALVKAAGVESDALPITFESLWNAVENIRGAGNAGI